VDFRHIEPKLRGPDEPFRSFRAERGRGTLHSVTLLIRSLTGRKRSVDYEKPEVESQVDVTGIMGWGGLPNKDPYH
jgi:hypothetical protein